jgi:hypothetical protein
MRARLRRLQMYLRRGRPVFVHGPWTEADGAYLTGPKGIRSDALPDLPQLPPRLRDRREQGR